MVPAGNLFAFGTLFYQIELFSSSCDVTRPLNVVFGGLGLDRICNPTKIKKSRDKIHELTLLDQKRSNPQEAIHTDRGDKKTICDDLRRVRKD